MRLDCILYMTATLIAQDLSRLGRDLGQVVIIDNSPASYIFHPDNAVSTRPLNNSNHIPINSNHIPNAVSTCALNNSNHIPIDSMYTRQTKVIFWLAFTLVANTFLYYDGKKFI